MLVIELLLFSWRSSCYVIAVKLIVCLLQSIKAATEDGLCGDRISEELLDAADDLYHSRIPSKWNQLGGDSSPPPTWSLAAWFTDLGNRFSHIDRIIVQVTKAQILLMLGAYQNSVVLGLRWFQQRANTYPCLFSGSWKSTSLLARSFLQPPTVSFHY